MLHPGPQCHLTPPPSRDPRNTRCTLARLAWVGGASLVVCAASPFCWSLPACPQPHRFLPSSYSRTHACPSSDSYARVRVHPAALVCCPLYSPCSLRALPLCPPCSAGPLRSRWVLPPPSACLSLARPPSVSFGAAGPDDDMTFRGATDDPNLFTVTQHRVQLTYTPQPSK